MVSSCTSGSPVDRNRRWRAGHTAPLVTHGSCARGLQEIDGRDATVLTVRGSPMRLVSSRLAMLMTGPMSVVRIQRIAPNRRSAGSLQFFQEVGISFA